MDRGRGITGKRGGASCYAHWVVVRVMMSSATNVCQVLLPNPSSSPSYLVPQIHVPLDLFVLLVIIQVVKMDMAVWSCVITTPGAQYVGTLAGTTMLQRWCVSSLAMVRLTSNHMTG